MERNDGKKEQLNEQRSQRQPNREILRHPVAQKAPLKNPIAGKVGLEIFPNPDLLHSPTDC